MKKRLSLIAALAVAGGQVFAQSATSLPATIQTDQATIQQDKTNLENAYSQLRADEIVGNTAAIAADRTAIQLGRLQLRLDFAKLHQDAQVILQPDQTALLNALTQLHNDQAANNTGALQADQAAMQAAETQLHNDREAIFGGLDVDTRHMRHHPRQ